MWKKLSAVGTRARRTHVGWHLSSLLLMLLLLLLLIQGFLNLEQLCWAWAWLSWSRWSNDGLGWQIYD